jgi:hypothetical protein
VFAQDVPIGERSHRSDKLAWKLIAGRRLTTVYSKGSLRMKATPQFIPKQPHRRKMEMQQNVQRLPLLAFVLETLIAICIVAVLSTFAFWSLLKVYGLIP